MFGQVCVIARYCPACEVADACVHVQPSTTAICCSDQQLYVARLVVRAACPDKWHANPMFVNTVILLSRLVTWCEAAALLRHILGCAIGDMQPYLH